MTMEEGPCRATIPDAKAGARLPLLARSKLNSFTPTGSASGRNASEVNAYSHAVPASHFGDNVLSPCPTALLWPAMSQSVFSCAKVFAFIKRLLTKRQQANSEALRLNRKTPLFALPPSTQIIITYYYFQGSFCVSNVLALSSSWGMGKYLFFGCGVRTG